MKHLFKKVLGHFFSESFAFLEPCKIWSKHVGMDSVKNSYLISRETCTYLKFAQVSLKFKQLIYSYYGCHKDYIPEDQ